MLPKISEGADREEKREWLGDFVRIIILIWSAGLLTASYVRLPSGQKIMDFDPTFIASVFSGSLAGFGVAVAKNGVQSTNNGSQSTPETPVYSRPKDEEEKVEPEVQPVWSEPEPTPEPAVALEQRVEALEAKVDSEEPPSEEGFVQPRRGDL
jgi:hypothetical protein